MKVITAEEKERVRKLATEVRHELYSAMESFGPMASAHEGYAVILEELDELWVEVKDGRPGHARAEAVQVAAMALRFLFDLYDERGAPR